jgi:putative spermidine/putrescine transport system permease protein
MVAAMSGPQIGTRAPEALEALTESARPRPPRRRRFNWWALVWIVSGALYFVIPLVATVGFSLQPKPFYRAYQNTFTDPQFYSTLLYSFGIGIATIVGILLLIVPTAFWVHLRLPRWRPIVEFITLLPFVIPAVVLVFGLIRVYGSRQLPLLSQPFGSDILLVCAYIVLGLPYMYRSVDVGLRAIDVRSLTEAAQSLGAGWARILFSIILPNLRVALLSGAFLTLAIVIGEFTIAVFLARPAFGPYLSLLGQNKPYEPAAVAIVSFGITWLAMGIIAFIGRGQRGQGQIAGAR